MRIFITLFFSCLLSTIVLAQTAAPKPSIVIKGTVTDSAIKAPLSFVTVTLQDAKTKQSIRSGLTKDDGSFSIKATAGGAYQLVFAFVGYGNKTVQVPKDGNEVSVGKIVLSSSSKQLAGVSITATKPLVKQEIDRISYDVQADPETKTQNVLDMLRKVPLITVDANDNIQMKGNSNYKILINGKPSSLVAHNPSDVFKSMPASSIQRIEVITTPPAKYDAEGLAGIINIITNKKVDQGYNGNVNMRYNSIYGPGGGASLTVKDGKFGLSMYTGGSVRKATHSSSQNSLQTSGDFASDLEQSGASTNKGHFLYNSEELSYEIDSLNLLTATFDVNGATFNSTNNLVSKTFDPTGLLTQSYQQNNMGATSWSGFDVGFNYQLGFKSNKDRLLTFSYKFSRSPNGQNNNIDVFDRYKYGQPSLQQKNNTGTREQTFQADYVHPLKKLNIEGGVKAILRNNFSDFETGDLDTVNNVYVNNSAADNNFNYRQDIYSLYNTYQLNLKDWAFKGGVRIENTAVNANFVTENLPVNQNYTDFIPSISIQRKFKGSSINFGFTNRIQRPDISQLNPFVDSLNTKFISTGNPNLRPVLNHTFELNYSKFSKGYINLGLSYSFAGNTIQNVTKLLDTVTYTTYQNVGSDKNLGANISVNYPITKKLNLNINGNISYVFLRGFINGELYSNQGIQGYTFAYAGYRFNDTWRAGINGGFYTANVLLQGKSGNYLFSSISTSKDILKKKVSLFLNVSNPFSEYRKYTSNTHDVNFYQNSVSQNPYRSINVGLSYRFGKLKEDIKKNKRGIENDDLKGGNKGDSGSK
ncbi:MAG: outer membrane beta-barrel protein [Sphingobacteriales bacterium]